MYSLAFTPLYDDLNALVKYQDSKVSSINCATVRTLLENIFENDQSKITNYLDGIYTLPSHSNHIILDKYEFLNNGFLCNVIFHDGYYSGYVSIDNSNLKPHEIEVLSNISNSNQDLDIYQPHNGLTIPFGFDCFQPGDIWLSRNGIIELNKDGVSTFKTKKYVIDELTKYSNSLRLHLMNHA